MATVNPALRAKLLGQKKSMESGGTLIDNKNFTKERMRLLPIQGEETPGKEYLSLFAPTLKRGTTSPLTYGLRCPVSEALDKIYKTGDKEDKEFAKNFINRSTEYWIGVLCRSELGTIESPNVRILRAKRSVYETVIGWLLDEDIGEDISDPQEGRDFLLKKEGKGLDTVWKCEKLDRAPISDDPAYVEAVVEMAQSFDPTNYFFGVDVEVLCQMYEGLTGESVPASILDPIKAFVESKGKKGGAPGKATPPAGKPATQAAAPSRPSRPAPTPPPAEPEDTSTGDHGDDGAAEQDPNYPIGMRVVWDENGEQMKGAVVGMDEDPEYAGNIMVQADGSAEGDDPWSLPPSDLKAEEVKPVVAKRKPAGTSPAQPPAATAPAKPAAASSGIKARLAGKK